MACELNEENLKKAYRETLACTGIGKAINKCDEMLPELVKKVVPEAMHKSYPAQLLACAVKICTNEPYKWTVKNEEPIIDNSTTFEYLWYNWFIYIVIS